jgi:hypothetical protein
MLEAYRLSTNEITERLEEKEQVWSPYMNSSQSKVASSFDPTFSTTPLRVATPHSNF